MTGVIRKHGFAAMLAACFVIFGTLFPSVALVQEELVVYDRLTDSLEAVEQNIVTNEAEKELMLPGMAGAGLVDTMTDPEVLNGADINTYKAEEVKRHLGFLEWWREFPKHLCLAYGGEWFDSSITGIKVCAIASQSMLKEYCGNVGGVIYTYPDKCIRTGDAHICPQPRIYKPVCVIHNSWYCPTKPQPILYKQNDLPQTDSDNNTLKGILNDVWDLNPNTQETHDA